MTEELQVYKCEICGNIVEVLHSGPGQLVCCGEPMTLLSEKSEDAGKEKHVPVVEQTSTGVRVRVGSVPHPMSEKHLIEWVEAISEGGVFRKRLSPGAEPVAEFPVKPDKVRAFCNVHGLWKA